MNKRALFDTLAAAHRDIPIPVGTSGLTTFLETLINQIKTAHATNACVFTAGNGGSAAEAQHLTAELVGRYEKDRPPINSQCLNADTSVITCIANDFGYDKIFSRQLECKPMHEGIFIAFSTSGNSKNIIEALEAANKRGLMTFLFTGKGGGVASELANYVYIVASEDTAFIQEEHLKLIHLICKELEK